MNKPVLGILGLTMALSAAFTNCSPVEFGKDIETLTNRIMGAKGGVIINNGDEFTNQADVDLAIETGSDEMYVTNDSTCETGGVWETYSPNRPWKLSSTNGSARVYIKFRESSAHNVESDCRTDDIVHDDVPPVVGLTKEPAKYVQASADLSFNATDSGSGLSHVECSSDGSTWEKCVDTYSRASLSEGPHVYRVIATDRAGNKSPISEALFTVDRTKPVLTITQAPPAVSGTTNSSFEFSAIDVHSEVTKYECRPSLSAAWQDCSSPWTLTATEGSNSVAIRATDAAGNVSNEARHTWTVDLTAPSVQITKSPDANTNQLIATFEFRSADPSDVLVKYECSLDGGAFATCSTPHATAALSAGTHTFAVRGYDSAGNMSSPTSKSWLIDTTAPIVAFTLTPASFISVTNATYSFTATDSASGVERIECQIDGAGFKSCTAPQALSSLAEGNHTYSVRAYDRAGNVSNPITHSFTVDMTKPVVQITSTPSNPSKDVIANFTFTATDNIPGTPPSTECRVDSGAFGSCVSPFAISNLEDGSHTFYVRAMDRAGLVSDVKSYTWLKDTTAPAINYSQIPAAVTPWKSPAIVQFSVTDAGTAVADVKCGLNDSLATCKADSTMTFDNLPVGSYKFTVLAKDSLGNEAKNEIVWKVEIQSEPQSQDVDINSRGKIDVLVVIDNSGSMGTEQANMASRFNGFLNKLEGLDWQVAITTTDMNTTKAWTDGRLAQLDGHSVSPAPYILKSTDPVATANAAFSATIQREEYGSSSEQGIRATYRAIQRAAGTTTVDAPNKEFFRTGSALAVLVVTDSDETNPNGTLDSNTPDGLLRLVQITWSGQKAFAFHSIIVKPDDSVCLSKDGNERYGRAYDTLSKKTGGIVGTVCSPDYATQLATIGDSVVELSRAVTLKCEPLDLNGDGKPEITVVTPDGSPTPAYTVSGLKVTFAERLPNGVNKISYSCLKK